MSLLARNPARKQPLALSRYAVVFNLSLQKLDALRAEERKSFSLGLGLPSRAVDNRRFLVDVEFSTTECRYSSVNSFEDGLPHPSFLFLRHRVRVGDIRKETVANNPVSHDISSLTNRRYLAWSLNPSSGSPAHELECKKVQRRGLLIPDQEVRSIRHTGFFHGAEVRNCT